MRRVLASPRTLGLLAAVLAALATAGVAVATSVNKSSKSKTLTGCYSDSSGALRILVHGSTCKKGELKVSWNQQGPKGKTGPQGIPGAQGSTGPKGETGAPGSKGETGVQGPAGVSSTSAMVLAGAVAFIDPTETTGFIGITGSQNVAASGAAIEGPVPAGTVRDFRAQLATDPPSALALTLLDNGAATAVTCAIATTSTSCSDTTHSVTVAAGDRLSVKVTHASGAVHNLRWSAELSPS